MRIIFFGTPGFAVPTLQRLIDRPEFTVVGVVTQPDRRRGRGTATIASPVKVLAEAASLPIWQPDRLRTDTEVKAKLRQSEADAFVVVAYGQILSPKVLALPRLGCINAHGSLLPAYRGAAPIQRCLVAGEARTGIVTMLMDKGMDTGPMLLRSETAIELLDHADSLAHRLAEQAADLMVESLLKLAAGELVPEAQNHDEATYAPPIQKEDYILDWKRPAIDLHNQIRGFYPHCLTHFRGAALKITGTAPLGPEFWAALPPEFSPIEHDWPSLSQQFAASPGANQPGAIVGIIKHVGPVVQTGQGYLLLRQVVPAGKRTQSGWDFANGAHLKPGEAFDPEPAAVAPV